MPPRKRGNVSPSHGLEYSRGGSSAKARQTVDIVMAKVSRSVDASLATTMPALPRTRQTLVSPVRGTGREASVGPSESDPEKPSKNGGLVRRGSKDSLSGSLVGGASVRTSASASSSTTAVRKKKITKKSKPAK